MTRFLREVEDARVLALDTEFSGPMIPGSKRGKDRINTHAADLTGISLCLPGWQKGLYIPVDHRGYYNADPEWVRDLLMRSLLFRTGPTWLWNAKADRRVLARYLKRVHNIRIPAEQLFSCTRDAQLAAYLLDRRAPGKKPFALKPHAKMTLGVDRPDWEATSNGRQACDIPIEEIYDYAAADAHDTLHLADAYYTRILQAHMGFIFNVEMDFLDVIQHMEDSGVNVDTDGLLSLASELQVQVNDLREEWDLLFPGVNIASAHQVAQFFYPGQKLVISPDDSMEYEAWAGLWNPKGIRKGKKGLHSVDGDAMELQLERCQPGTLGHRAAELRLEYQDLTKNLSTYTTSLVAKVKCMPDGRLHPSFNQTVTRTYRLSSSDPNFQQIPVRTALGRQIRARFEAPKGRILIKGDYSQIELRVLAHLAGPGVLLDAFVEGKDVHQATADAMGIDRDTGKILNFLVVYGGRESRIMKLTGAGKDVASRHYNKFWRTYPEISALKEKTLDFAREHGYVVTMMGHRRATPLLREYPKGKGIPYELRGELWKEERIAFNTGIQGGAADINKLAAINLYKKLRSMRLLGSVKIIGQVHDENILEAPEELAPDMATLLKSTMEEAAVLRCPLVADVKVVRHWAEGKG